MQKMFRMQRTQFLVMEPMRALALATVMAAAAAVLLLAVVAAMTSVVLMVVVVTMAPMAVKQQIQ